MADSFFLVIAVTTFALGIVLFLVSISSTSWQGLDGGVTISLWKVCYRHHVDKSWFCNSWHEIPGNNSILTSYERIMEEFSLCTIII
jgi:hypothetical protein